MKKIKILFKQIFKIPIFNYSFVLYSNNIGGIKEYEKVDGKYIKLSEPIEIKMFGVYRHSFPCSLKQAIKYWEAWKQILKFQKFYYSIGNDKKTYIESGTKFNIFLLPLVYLYCLIDTKKFNKVSIIYNKNK